MSLPNPDRYVVIGNPIAHSKSPHIHARFAAQTKQAIDYQTLLAPLDSFTTSVRGFIASGGKGANVTVPFKEEAFRLAQTLTPRAETAGAVNTLSFAADGHITGDNTDGAGLVRDITHNLYQPLKGKRILLLGAGGAARGVFLPLLEQAPLHIFVANRTAGKAVEIVEEITQTHGESVAIGGGFSNLSNETFDVIINATSAGLSDTALDVPSTVFAPNSLAYDMVYGRTTPFMKQAQAAGAQVADGLGMLVEQAAEAFFIWRGVRPDTGPVIKAMRTP